VKENVWDDAPDFTDPQVIADPFPHYERMFKYGKPYFDTVADAWTFFDYSNCNQMLKDKRFSVNRLNIYLPRLPADMRKILKPLFDRMDYWMIFQDPPAHTRLRSPLVRAFDSKMVTTWETWFKKTMDSMIEDVLNQNRFELITSLAFPLPILLICEILGLPAEDKIQLKKWTQDLTDFFDHSTDPHKVQTALTSEKALSDYMRAAIDKNRAKRGENLLGYLIDLQDQNENIFDEDMVGTAALLLGAGHETTTSLLASAAMYVFGDADLKRRAIEEPERLSQIVEETLRHAPPVHRTGRIATEDIEIGGVVMAKGQRAQLFIAAANRDPAVFEKANSFSVDLPRGQNLSFSAGPHFCAGARLAKMECEIMLDRLLEQRPDLKLAPQNFLWQENATFRCLKEVWLH